jgi:hypothetical protein
MEHRRTACRTAASAIGDLDTRRLESQPCCPAPCTFNVTYVNIAGSTLTFSFCERLKSDYDLRAGDLLLNHFHFSIARSERDLLFFQGSIKAVIYLTVSYTCLSSQVLPGPLPSSYTVL